MLHSEITGDVPEIIRNEENLYEGDLIHYLRTLFFKARNLNNPYHNLRHTLHVLWLCHKACRYYQSELTPRQMICEKSSLVYWLLCAPDTVKPNFLLTGTTHEKSKPGLILRVGVTRGPGVLFQSL